MRPTIELDVPPRHVDGGFPKDWMTVQANNKGVLIQTTENGATSYTFAEPTRNPRVLAQADAVLWEGNVARPYYEDKYVELQHTMAGRVESLRIDEHLEESVPTLERTQLVDLKGTGGIVEFECSDCGEHIKRDRNHMDVAGMTPSRCTSCTMNRMG